MYNEKVKQYINSSLEENYALIEKLSLIPSPSHFEDEKAEFCKRWLEEAGADGVYIDEAKNVVYPLNCENSNEIIVFMAHTDTVFPASTPLFFKRDEENFYAPGVGDDTCCLTAMMFVIKYIIQNNIKPKTGILFVANSCEEGLGNLKGSRQIVKDFGDRIKEFYTFDGVYSRVANRCVGSHRYEIKCTTVGGHSYGAFGNPNAIVELSKLICELSSVTLPKKEGCKTTFNVGIIEGGTSVNTIAQSAKMLYEYRSDDVECLAEMKAIFEEKIAAANESDKAQFSVKTVGIRPCADGVDQDHLNAMTEKVIRICEKHSGIPCLPKSSSTDCNSAASVGIPAICVGAYLGGGAHTIEEYVNIKSLEVGMNIAAELILDYFN